jgi:hypothetical protein
MKVVINNRGEYYDVDSSFLDRIKIIKEEEIGDVVFITGEDDVYFSIDRNQLAIAKRHNKIKSVLD